MAKRVFNLHNVDEDEAHDIERLLDSEQIPYYRTHPNPWGFSTAALWVNDPSDWQRARQLIDQYQTQRQERLRACPPASEPFWTRLWQAPVTVLTYCVVAVVIILLSVAPFIRWALSN